MQSRLQKLMADAGVASRRASEEIIKAGRVTVNGKIVSDLGAKFDSETATVAVDGVEVRRKKKIYLALNKPRQILCSRSDPQTRRTVGDLLPKEWAHLYTVGRLDLDSEGLLFLTNDGEFSLKLTHPRFGVSKKYLTTVEGRVDFATLSRIRKGITHDGAYLKAEKVRLLDANGHQSLIEVELKEGKNREVRRLFESQDLKVLRLQRIQIGAIKLGELREGKWRTLSAAEIRSLTQPKEKTEQRRSTRH